MSHTTIDRAELRLTLRDPEGYERCRNCKKTKDDHVNGQCLFESTSFDETDLLHIKNYALNSATPVRVTLHIEGYRLAGTLRPISTDTGWQRHGESPREFTVTFASTFEPVTLDLEDGNAPTRT